MAADPRFDGYWESLFPGEVPKRWRQGAAETLTTDHDRPRSQTFSTTAEIGSRQFWSSPLEI
jgi:hypothetical protein